uniref:Uncharacterized protein n=1 Tax=Romanomermis culicivorax TaxID=13658 RepID=A0A915K3K0_ROMCU
MCIILSTLEESGFSVTCSADVSAKYESRQNMPDYPVDVHSWFVTRSQADFRQPRLALSNPHDDNERATSASGGRPTFEYPNEPPPSYKELYGK